MNTFPQIQHSESLEMMEFPSSGPSPGFPRGPHFQVNPRFGFGAVVGAILEPSTNERPAGGQNTNGPQIPVSWKITLR